MKKIFLLTLGLFSIVLLSGCSQEKIFIDTAMTGSNMINTGNIITTGSNPIQSTGEIIIVSTGENSSTGRTGISTGDSNINSCDYNPENNKLICDKMVEGLEIRNIIQNTGYAEAEKRGDIYYNNTLIYKDTPIFYFCMSDMCPLQFSINTQKQYFIFKTGGGDICGAHDNDKIIGFDGKEKYNINYAGMLNPKITLDSLTHTIVIFFSDASQKLISEPTQKNLYNALYMQIKEKNSGKTTTKPIYSFSPISYKDECGRESIFNINLSDPIENQENIVSFTTNTRKISIDLENISNIKVDKIQK